VSGSTQINLVADVGGTNTRVGLSQGARLRGDTVRKYPNKAHGNLEDVLTRFIADSDLARVDGACVAVAGPVRDGQGELTNLAWTFQDSSLARATGAKQVAILNDLQAQGHGLDGLDTTKLRQILPGSAARPDAAKLVVGVGTGFNAAPVFRSGPQKLVPPSESGHGPLPVSNETELALARHITQKFGYPEVEEVLSGRGLEGLYAYFAQANGQTTTKDAAAIMEAMARADDKVAEQTVSQFIRTLGITIGALAMVQLPFGGIYLIGGVARAMAPYFERFGFADAVQEKGRFTTFVQAFPLHVVEDDFAALIGCAEFLAQQRAP